MLHIEQRVMSLDSEIAKKVQERRLNLQWYGHVMSGRGAPRRKEGDGNESTREKEERKTYCKRSWFDKVGVDI